MYLGRAVPRRGDAHERRRRRRRSDVFGSGRVRGRRFNRRRVDRPRRLRVVDVHRRDGGFRGARVASGSPQAGDGILHARRGGRQSRVAECSRVPRRRRARLRRRFDPRRFDQSFGVSRRRRRRPAGAQRVVLHPRRPQRLAQVPALLLQPVHVGSQPRVLRGRRPPPSGELLEQVVDGWRLAGGKNRGGSGAGGSGASGSGARSSSRSLLDDGRGDRDVVVGWVDGGW